MPTSTLGIRAVDDLTLELESEEACPPLPGMMKFGFPLHKNALEAHGPYTVPIQIQTREINQIDFS